MTERYLEFSSVVLCGIRDDLIEIERKRLKLVDRAAITMSKAREFGFDRETLNHLEALSYNKAEHDITPTLEYLESRMYKPEPDIALPGMTETSPVILPGM